jgi:hypothetical protein
MNKSMYRKLFLAAAVAFTGSISWGQQLLRADIPFEFHVPGGNLPAGSYEIRTGMGPDGRLAQLYNTVAKKSHLVMFTGRTYGPPNSTSSPARLVFRHSGLQYSLAEMWRGTPGDGFWLAQPRPSREEKIELATIRLQAPVAKQSDNGGHAGRR